MKTIIENLKKQIESQKQQVKALNVESRSLWNKAMCDMSLSDDERRALSERGSDISQKLNEELHRLDDLRQALYYLLRASGAENIDGFNPGQSC